MDRRQYQQKYHKKYYAANVELISERTREWHRQNPYAYLIKNARRRAKLAGLPCTITSEDIIIPEFCPILGAPLTAKTRYAPSVDRIEPSKGYVKGNVWVVSTLANRMKSDATVEELERFAEWVKTLRL